MRNRGLTFWSDAGGRNQRLFVAVRQYLYALDAKPATSVPVFGQAGRIDLRDGLGRTQKDKDIVTIEGLSANADHPVQQAWKASHVPQCGYYQSGQIMQAVAFAGEADRTLIEMAQ